MYLIDEIEIINLAENDFLLLNLINGNADVIDNTIATKLLNSDYEHLNKCILDTLKERKYMFDNEKDYQDYIADLNKELLYQSYSEAPNFVLLPTFDCNLNCYYCFEKGYEKNDGIIKKLDIQKVFAGIDRLIKRNENIFGVKYSKEDILITITGGEPLLLEQKDMITSILERGKKEGYKLSIVTNGTTIDLYEHILEKYEIDNIQITIDGGKTVHDKIRIGKNGEETFDIIVENLLIAQKLANSVCVRINVNRKNIESISELAPLIEANPNVIFYVYIMQQEGCFDFQNIIEESTALERLNHIKNGDTRLSNLIIEYHGRNLVESAFYNKKFRPRIKVCAAAQNQYIIDYNESIYKCWWGMGSKDYEIGYINDIENLDEDIYLKRNIFSLKKCEVCKYRYICGGGCTGRFDREDLYKGKVKCANFREILTIASREEYEKYKWNLAHTRP